MRDFNEGKMMKKTSIFLVSGIVLCLLTMWLTGCGVQPGETKAEGRRRHIRNTRINKQEMMQDIDRSLLLDQPSKLSDKRIP